MIIIDQLLAEELKWHTLPILAD